MKKFLETHHSPDVYFAKLIEEVGEVAEAHLRVHRIAQEVADRAEQGPSSAQRKRLRAAVSHLDEELSHVAVVTHAWHSIIEPSPQS